jgi:hypothetical protein
VGGHWATFFEDLRAALKAWGRWPFLPLIAIIYSIAWWASRYPYGLVIVLLLALFQAGWVGTERIFYLRYFKNKGMRKEEPARLTRAFMGRFIS